MSGFDLAGLASDAKEVVKALKLDRYVLIGHSMGGKVAQLIASERPEKLSGLILVAPAMPGPLRFPPERREDMVKTMDSAVLIQQAIDNMLTAKRLSPEVNAQVIEDALRGSPEAKRAWPISTSQEALPAKAAAAAAYTCMLPSLRYNEVAQQIAASGRERPICDARLKVRFPQHRTSWQTINDIEMLAFG